jgi:hypothetical protein
VELCQRFPNALTWGQAQTQAEGIARNLPLPDDIQGSDKMEEHQTSIEKTGRTRKCNPKEYVPE